MNARDGGPAFPCSKEAIVDATIESRGELQISQSAQIGMSLRDYFAAASIPIVSAGMQSAQARLAVDAAEFAAVMAYKIADAMLAERSK